MSNYKKYLESYEWKVRRLRALQDAEHKCTRCGSTCALEVHHLRYANLGNEAAEDLIVVCGDCHAQEHADADSKSNRSRSGYRAALDKWAYRKYGCSFDKLNDRAQYDIESSLRRFVGLQAKQ